MEFVQVIFKAIGIILFGGIAVFFFVYIPIRIIIASITKKPYTPFKDWI